jgi:hypothetical protein
MKNFYNFLLCAGAFCGVALTFVSCDKDDDNNSDETSAIGAFFLSVSGSEKEFILQTNNPDAGVLSIADNNEELELTGYTWIFNAKPSVAIGLIYQQGDPGIGLGYTVSAEGKLQKVNNGFQITNRFTTYGFFDHYAVMSAGGFTMDDGATDGVVFTLIDLENGLSMETKTMHTKNINGNGEQATLSGIVDMGNGEFLSGLVLSQPKDETGTGGSSSGTINYPDSVWVGAFDANLTLKRLYRSDKLSYASGRYRSQYYSQIDKADDGTAYIFSGSYESATTKPCGALRIKQNATDFDATYYFNIEEKTGGYRFRKVWYISGNYFLLELYNDLTASILGTATQYGVVDMEAKTFKWVTGIPAKDQITATGMPMAYGGQMYCPVTTDAEDPTVYIIDPATATATKGVSVKGATSINAIGRLQ